MEMLGTKGQTETLPFSDREREREREKERDGEVYLNKSNIWLWSAHTYCCARPPCQHKPDTRTRDRESRVECGVELHVIVFSNRLQTHLKHS